MTSGNPPHLSFELLPVEDRTATIECGSPQYTDVLHVTVTPAGAKDRTVHTWDDWIARQRTAMNNGRLPVEWLNQYQAQHELFLKDASKVLVTGTPITQWPMMTPAKVKTLHALHLYSVEQVAKAVEDQIVRMGMDGRNIVAQAKTYVANTEKSALAGQITALREQVATLTARNAELTLQLKA